MKKIYQREIRHILANHTLSNKATGYCLKSKSISFKIIQKLIKQNWVECKTIDNGFVFVVPTKKLVTTYGPLAIINKPSAIPATKRNWIWSHSAKISSFNPAEIAAA